MFVFWFFLHERGSRKNPSNLFSIPYLAPCIHSHAFTGGDLPLDLEVLRNAHLNEGIGARLQELGKIHTEQGIGQKRRDES